VSGVGTFRRSQAQFTRQLYDAQGTTGGLTATATAMVVIGGESLEDAVLNS
jgi:hypothetical protein